MTYEIFSSFKSHIIRWPRHLLMVGGLCLLVACGGGGGGSGGVAGSTTAQKPTYSLSLQTASVYANGKPAVLIPKYDIGSGQLTCTDKTSGSVVFPATYVPSDTPVQVPLAADANCSLIIYYKNTQTVRDELLQTNPTDPSATQLITVTPMKVVVTSVNLTSTKSVVLSGESTTLTATITTTDPASQSITGVDLIGDDATSLTMEKTTNPLVYTYTLNKVEGTTAYHAVVNFKCSELRNNGPVIRVLQSTRALVVE